MACRNCGLVHPGWVTCNAARAQARMLEAGQVNVEVAAVGKANVQSGSREQELLARIGELEGRIEELVKELDGYRKPVQDRRTYMREYMARRRRGV